MVVLSEKQSNSTGMKAFYRSIIGLDTCIESNNWELASIIDIRLFILQLLEQ